MAYTTEQRRVLKAIKRIGRERGVPARYVKAAIETGLGESGLRNLNYGDADSLGWRQERASKYSNPTNLKASIGRFYDEASQLDHGQGPGRLAADVQRPAAQYRGRYRERASEAQALLGGGGTPPRASLSSVDPAARQQLLLGYLQRRNDPNALLDLAQGLGALKPLATQAEPSTSTSGTVQRVAHRAAAIDRQHLPYQWGGGHGNTGPGQPLDCSGAVSKALGIDARVSGEFTKWGKPGEGGNKGVTVYANDKHVLMKIDGRLWGTSASNPGGGAGWIDSAHVSKQYLAGFTARHL